MNKEAMQMFTTPAECILKDFVEFGDTGCADHEQSPPHQRTHAAEHYAKLINRNGHDTEGSGMQTVYPNQAYSLEPDDPPESPALRFRRQRPWRLLLLIRRPRIRRT